MNQIKNILQNIKLRLVVLKCKLSSLNITNKVQGFWTKLSKVHKTIILVSSIAIIFIMGLAITISHSKHKYKKIIDLQPSVVITPKEAVANAQKSVIKLAPPVEVDHNQELKHRIAALESQNKELNKELSKHKDELATKQDIQKLVNYIDSNNQSIQQSIAQNQEANIKLYQQLESNLNSQINQVISQNPTKIDNHNFKVQSIIWINGQELLMVRDFELSRDVSITVGDTYKGWKLLTINKKHCAIFKNKKGVNTQCVH